LHRAGYGFQGSTKRDNTERELRRDEKKGHLSIEDGNRAAILAWDSILLAVLIGFSSGDWKLGATLVLWTLLAVLLYRFRPPLFILTAQALAFAEETLVYAFGGGLQGQATSLARDLVLTMPVFAGFVLGWFWALRIQPWSETALYLGAGLHGFLLELLLTGLIGNPVAVVLHGGPVLFIYASIVLVLRPQQPGTFVRFRCFEPSLFGS
jgi:hypothetical protein